MWGTHASLAVLVLLQGGSAGCSRRLPQEDLLWTTGAVRGAYAGGDVATGDGHIWVAHAEEPRPGDERIRVRHADARRSAATRPDASMPVVASFPGGSPGLAVQGDGSLWLASAERGAIVLRRGARDGRTWSAPRRISPPPDDCSLAPGRLARTPRGTLLVPAVRGAGESARVACFRSPDEGASWSEIEVLRAADAADPAVAATHGDELLLVARLDTILVRCTSSDDGATWTAPERLGIATGAVPHSLEHRRGGVALAWTDPLPDTTWAAPGLRAVRLAVSSDAGRSWRRLAPLAWRAGAVPGAAALSFDGTRLAVLLETRAPGGAILDCVSHDVRQLEPAVRLPPPERARGRYAVDGARAADALALLAAHTLARPSPSQRLFIEGYFMRSLVAAHEVLREVNTTARRGAASAAPGWPRDLDTARGVLQAISFADWMVAGQDSAGYWPLGYKAVYVADMAAVVGLLAVLEPHVETARARGYVAAAERFARALERDGMLLANGACGVGWMQTRLRDESAAVRDPYPVSTALAGVVVHAWLYARTGNLAYRERARAALAWTLAQLRPDGSFPDLLFEDGREGAFAIAAYVQEGWMAADVFLGDETVRHALRRALAPHVAWLVRAQRPDGLWGTTGEDGEWARTPSILDFLVWYDRRCEERPEVRAALRRASGVLVDPDRWRGIGLGRAGKNEEVLRALAGRALAALAAERPIP